MKFSGQTFVVTGGGRGLGKAIAVHLATSGASIATCARSMRELDVLRREMEGVGTTVLTVPIDVTDIEAMHHFAQTVVTELGPAVGLVNNAAVLGPIGRIDAIDLDEWRRTIEIDLFGVANACAAFTPQMIARGGGSIVNISGGGVGGANIATHVSAYFAAKVGVVALSEALARELEAARIHVHALAPGPLETSFLRAILDVDAGGSDETLRSTAVEMHADVPTEPLSLDAGFTELLDLLLSDDAAGLTGKLLSARWDAVDILRSQTEAFSTSSVFNLRRIDDVLFREIEED